MKRFQKPLKNWVKFSIWAIIYVLFVAWVGNFWWLLLLPLILDVFITKFIPYTWWKNSKNKTVRSVMSWVDAIVFALVAVYFINLYLFQNYQIPTSSLEKSLLVGDFLFVSKASYGPRVPNTPLSFPLVQNTFPWGTKSYSDAIQWKYKRLKGWDKVEHGDIVVFNFPTGDTVPLKVSNPDYYSLCNIYGRDVVRNNEAEFGEIIYRPVDRRENYVKRCVGLPADTLQIVDNQIYINGKIEKDFAGVQYNYFIQTDGTALTETFFDKLKISKEDRETLYEYFINNRIQDVPEFYAITGLDYGAKAYHFPMTKEVKEKVEKLNYIKKVLIEPDILRGGKVFPLNAEYGWTRDNFGPLVMPKSGTSVNLTLENLPIYEHIIRNYEGNRLAVKDSQIFINNIATTTYTFKMDYFWMMGDNRHKSADSRYWGFVPEDHIVGRPVFVWLSWDKDNKKIRWERIGRSAAE
ncbi:MAG: signal peptidase I [Prevotellaceae bacterium]|jgi:signal peptidase I|nr:signal peptidase I [Prevotellaceae bacterium]